MKINNIIELKHKSLINKAIEYMSMINDYEHDIKHMNDVVFYTYELLDSLNINVNKDACIISAYWHDVGRIHCDKEHEKLSANMLKKEMKKEGYDNQLINDCYEAIKNHKWNMKPKTNEGLIVKDADKLAWIGQERWKSSIENGQRLDSIIKLLPKLKSDVLYFNKSKEIYDKEIIKLVELLYNNILSEE
jgi:HD superfamily phosphodiesterase